METANFQEISTGTTYSVEVTPVTSGFQQARAVSVTIDNAAVHKVVGGAPNEQKNQVIDLILPVTGTEREALVALYNATDGASWTDSMNWLTTADLGEWHGVTTNTDGEVTQLDLRNNELSGSLPVALGNLRNLTHLYLHRNALSGPIPPDLGLFENLTHLYLHRNALSGEIPTRLGRLSNLLQLYLQGNELSGPIPPEFRLSSLVDLKLHSNADLSGPLPDISPTALSNLEELGMQNTDLTIPDTPAFTAWGARITDGTQTSDGVITLDAANTRPSGLWADSTTLYVVGEDGGKVYAYTLPSGVRDTTKDITLDAANTHPTGLWSDGTTLWVLDYDGLKIYAYTLADGERDDAKDIESVSAGYGLWGRKDATCTGSDAPCLLWVAGDDQSPIRLRAYRIYADTSASVTYGSANTDFDKDLPTGDLFDIESDVSGFWWKDPEPGGDPTVWISDRFDAARYAYSANPRAAENAADIESAAMQNRILAPANLSPTALWSDGTTWWVADLYAGQVFVYGLSAPPPVIMQDPLGMPQSFSAMPGDTQEVVLSWTAPASDGGEAITKYQYRYSAGSTVDTSATTATWTDVPDGADADTDTSDETTFTVTGLTNDTQYAFQVRAWNSGAGPPATDTATPIANNAPTVAIAISNQTATAGTVFNYAFPATTFNDADSDTLTYTATKSDGSALPSWLSFAAATRTFSGTPMAADVETVSVKVTASDGNGGSVSDTFDIVVSTAANNAAMGEPTISGTARVGRTLTASTTGIMDADGLTSPTYTYQWIRVNGSEADIASANSSTYILVDADLGKTIKVEVSFTDDASNAETLTSAATALVTAAAVTNIAPTTGGGGGGGGGGSSQDDHGNTPAQATPVTLDPTRTASVRGQINTAPDVDYFSAAVPHAGVLVVETSGPTATVGTVWQAGAELATAARGGVGQNFRLRVRVAPGSVVIALQGQGGATGAYTLQVTFLSGHLENPGAASFQSGIGVISGWTCDAEAVEIVLNGEPQEAAYGTARLDTEAMCGDSDNGFGLLFNWNLLRDGEHEVVALVDGVELDRATVTVTTLGTEFLRDVTGTCTAADFPDRGRDGHPGVATDTAELCDCGRDAAHWGEPGGESRGGLSGEPGTATPFRAASG